MSEFHHAAARRARVEGEVFDSRVVRVLHGLDPLIEAAIFRGVRDTVESLSDSRKYRPLAAALMGRDATFEQATLFRAIADYAAPHIVERLLAVGALVVDHCDGDSGAEHQDDSVGGEVHVCEGAAVARHFGHLVADRLSGLVGDLEALASVDECGHCSSSRSGRLAPADPTSRGSDSSVGKPPAAGAASATPAAGQGVAS